MAYSFQLMCGIAGIFGRNDADLVEGMVHSLRHRGPDGAGVWSGLAATLGHTRLSILEPGPSGSQPMLLVRDEGGASRAVPYLDGAEINPERIEAVLAFNGEIYNRDELLIELALAGVEVLGSSDTEVLLHHLSLHGEAVIPRLAGMFAFAFWRPKERQGVLAVDRFGIKPLYFGTERSSSIIFASEVRTLLAGLGDREPDAAALRQFLMWGSVGGPSTLTKGVSRLRGGQLLRWSEAGYEVEPWLAVEPARPFSGPTTVEELREALLESVQRHLLSDVPLCLFLSGGIDSTAILALAREVLGARSEINTFSIGFDNPAFDESRLAARTAAHFGACHHEWRFKESEARDYFSNYLSSIDQPTIDGFNTWCVSKFVAETGFKVALSGVGGDEFFGGYKSFRQVPLLLKLHQRIGPMRRCIGSGLRALGRRPRERRLADFLEGPPTPLAAYHAIRGTISPRHATDLTLQLTGVALDPWEWPDVGHIGAVGPRQVSELEVLGYMSNQLLTDSDVFSMAHGIELRVPLVDTRLADVVDSMEDAERFQSGKRVLVRALPEIPEWVYKQPKRGFRFPFDDWVDEMLRVEAPDLVADPPAGVEAWYQKWALLLARREMLNPPGDHGWSAAGVPRSTWSS